MDQKPTMYPVWVELPNLPLHFTPWIKTILAPMGKIIGTKAYSDFNPAWHPQVLVELDLSQNLPEEIAIGCGEYSHIQPILYKHLPNCYFHYEKQGHLNRNCPIKHPQLVILPVTTKPSQKQNQTTGTPPKQSSRNF